MDPLAAIARRQLADYRARTPGSYFSTGTLTVEEAYAVQDRVTALREAEGEQICGYKVGCTGPRVRAQFGMDGPIRGCLFAGELHRTGARLSHARYARLAIEGELAGRIGDDGELRAVFPVIELHHHVFRGTPPTLAELIANNGLQAGVVLPDPAVSGPLDRAATRLRIEINGALVEAGDADGVPGGPRGSLGWLARHLDQRGRRLQPGQLVLLGTPLGLHPVHRGDRVRVVAESLGEVTAAITA